MRKEILFLLLDKWSDWEVAYLSVGIQMLAEDSYDKIKKIISKM